MAVDLPQLKADLNKLREVDLEACRRLVDAALLVTPESPLADQEVVGVYQAWVANHSIYVAVIITSQPTPGNFSTSVLTSAAPGVNFVRASRWLFDWFNFRKDA